MRIAAEIAASYGPRTVMLSAAWRIAKSARLDILGNCTRNNAFDKWPISSYTGNWNTRGIRK